MGECLVKGCCKPTRARGWCAGHWNRWRRYGDPLAGFARKGAAVRYFREVVLRYEGDECLLWPFARTSKGYGRLVCKGRSRFVSRMVCEEINGPSPTPEHEAAHRCGRGHEGCVTPAHLRWATSAENHADMLLHGTIVRGEMVKTAKLTEDDVRAIRAMSGTHHSVIAEKFQISPQHVSKVIRGVKWGWLDGRAGDNANGATLSSQ